MAKKIKLNIRKDGKILVVENPLGLILCLISDGNVQWKVPDITFLEQSRINWICKSFDQLLSTTIEE